METEETDSMNFLTINDYMSLFKHSNYYGSWHITDNNHKIHNFENNHGIFILESSRPTPKNSGLGSSFQSDPAEHLQMSELNAPGSFSFLEKSSNQETKSIHKIAFDPPLKLTLKIYDGDYLDHQSIRMYYYMNSTTNLELDPNNAALSGYQKVKKYRNWHEQGSERQECNLHISFNFLNKNTLAPYKGPFDNTENLAIKVNVNSEDCNIKIEAPFNIVGGFVDKVGAKVYILASCIMTALNIAGVCLLKRRFKKKSEVHNLSIVSIWLTIAIDYYILIVNMVLIFSYAASISFAFILNVLLTFVLEKSLLTRILDVKSQRNSSQLLEEDCKSCSWHFAIAALFFIFQLVFVLMYELWILHFTALILVPQIIENFKKNRSYRFNFIHIGLIVAPKLIMIAYVKLYPRNIFRIAPEPRFVIKYAALILIQVLILMVQTKLPRLGFSLKRPRHGSKVLCDDDICPICMGHLASSNMEISPTFPRRPTIETTCTHSFHVPCLRQWASTKTECPLCRNNIEDILDELGLSDEE